MEILQSQQIIKLTVQAWEDEILKHKKVIVESINEILMQMHEKYSIKKEAQLRYISFSFLRSSLIDNRPFYHIGLYDDNWRLDINSVDDYWQINPISKILYNNITLLNPVNRNINDLKDDEVIKLWIKEGEKAMIAFENLFTEIIKEAIIGIGFKEHIRFSIGEYMDRQKILLEIRNDNYEKQR